MNPMVIGVSSKGVNVLYRCYFLPEHNCKNHDKNGSECRTCKYCKAEMSAADATRLLGGRGEG